MDDRESWMWLYLCPGLTPAIRKKYLQAHGSPQGAAREVMRKKAGPTYERMEKALRSNWLRPGDSLYPAVLRHLDDEAPEVLFYRGDPQGLAKSGPIVAVVGTRRATAQGRHQACRFTSALCAGGARIANGLALGIESAAQYAALKAPRACPICILPCGLDVSYPVENERLLSQIEECGIALSEYPPGTPPYASNFSARNRILAALARAILVVEAPLASGVQVIVDHGLRLGRDIFTLPGPVDHPNYRGNLGLLQEGAILVCDPEDLLSQIPSIRPGWLSNGYESEGPGRAEEWACRMGLSLTDALCLLSRWERLGRMGQDSDGYFFWLPGGEAGGASGAALGSTTGGNSLGLKGNFSN